MAQQLTIGLPDKIHGQAPGIPTNLIGKIPSRGFLPAVEMTCLNRYDLFWILGYGGGVFLPFRDMTNNDTTYGGGRYLLDTIKHADLGHEGHKLVIDFNYAYNPSCAYNSRWHCPLAPWENRLLAPITAGEMAY